MSNNSDIDKFFKQKLTDQVDETGYREDDWAELEKLMDGGKKRRGIVYWLPLLSGVAALLFLVLGWWLFSTKPEDGQTKPQKMTKTQPAKPQTNNASTNARDSAENSSQYYAVDQHKAENIQVGQRQQLPFNNAFPIAKQTETPIQKFDASPNVPAQQQVFKQPDVIAANPVAVKDTTKTVIANNITEPEGEITPDTETSKGMAAKQSKIERIGSPIFAHPQFALTLIGAPDINGVSSFSDGKTGSNVGLLFSVGFNKLRVSTGVTYSYKPYNTSFANYTRDNYYFKTSPVSVLADCRMLDIPLNLDYQIFNKNQNKISIGTGLSSYIMLRESYAYEYADPTTRGPRNYTIASPGKYFFGIANIQATYTRQINSKVGLSVQPYLKLPLGNVGASQVKLQSAGVALGLSWNINALKRQ